jgi:hypothetical protein
MQLTDFFSNPVSVYVSDWGKLPLFVVDDELIDNFHKFYEQKHGSSHLYFPFFHVRIFQLFEDLARSLYVIRPLVKSYGLNSTLTLSPGNIRI